MAKRKIRVLHCPTMVGGNPPRLARAERKLGLDSLSVAFIQNYFGYDADEVILDEGQHRIWLEIKRWKVLWRALRDFDIIHFNFGETISPFYHPYNPGAEYTKASSRLYNLYARFFHMTDLPLIKQAGKGIIVTYQGSDARQGDYCRANHEISYMHYIDPNRISPMVDRQKRRNIAKFDQYADHIFSLNPDLMPVLPNRAKFLPYAIDLNRWNTKEVEHDCESEINVLHAPSSRLIKGTEFILEAVRHLRDDGLKFRFTMVEGKSHVEAKELYYQADLVVDQLLAGWYGGLAVEAMALGKPVISYLRDEDLKFIPLDMRQELPIINSTPQSIYTILKEWLTTRRHELPVLGLRSREYVEKWHDSLKIAGYLKSIYEDIIESKHLHR